MPSVPGQPISIRTSTPFGAVPAVAVTNIPAGYGNGLVVPPAYSAPNEPYYVPAAEGDGDQRGKEKQP